MENVSVKQERDSSERSPLSVCSSKEVHLPVSPIEHRPTTNTNRGNKSDSNSHVSQHHHDVPDASTSSNNITNGTTDQQLSPTASTSSETPSPTFNGNPTPMITTPAHHVNRHPVGSLRLRRFLASLLHFARDLGSDVSDRVRGLIANLISGRISPEDFHHSLQDVTNYPLRPFVLPFLRAHLPPLQREVAQLAHADKQSPLQFVKQHEALLFDAAACASLGDANDIFHPTEENINKTNLKRKHESNSIYENGSSPNLSDSGDNYLACSTPLKRAAVGSGNAPSVFGCPPVTTFASINESSFITAPSPYLSLTPPVREQDEEWKNIHVMLNCILSMVEKTKRALTILQQRNNNSGSVESDTSFTSPPIWLKRPSPEGRSEQEANNSSELKRQAGELMAHTIRLAEDRVAEVKRRAEEAVREVKRQALAELHRAVEAAESRAMEVASAERARLERLLLMVDSARRADLNSDTERHPEQEGPSGPEGCWNCGRKAHDTCSGCNVARYCSSFCQHKDWESHHQVCNSNGRLAPLERRSVVTNHPSTSQPSSSQKMVVVTNKE